MVSKGSGEYLGGIAARAIGERSTFLAELIVECPVLTCFVLSHITSHSIEAVGGCLGTEPFGRGEPVGDLQGEISSQFRFAQ